MLSGVPVVRWKQLNQERDHGSGFAFLQEIRNLIKKNGSADIVDVDESGLEESTFRPFAGSKRGKRFDVERPDKGGVRTNRIAGKRGQEMITPVLDEETTKTWGFNKWMEEHRCQESRPKSTIILDNARFTPKKEDNRMANDK